MDEGKKWMWQKAKDGNVFKSKQVDESSAVNRLFLILNNFTNQFSATPCSQIEYTSFLGKGDVCAYFSFHVVYVWFFIFSFSPLFNPFRRSEMLFGFFCPELLIFLVYTFCSLFLSPSFPRFFCWCSSNGN